MPTDHLVSNSELNLRGIPVPVTTALHNYLIYLIVNNKHVESYHEILNAKCGSRISRASLDYMDYILARVSCYVRFVVVIIAMGVVGLASYVLMG